MSLQKLVIFCPKSLQSSKLVRSILLRRTGGGVWTNPVDGMVEGVDEWGLGGPAALDLLTIFWLMVVPTKVPIRLFYGRFLKLLPYYDSK